jgi:hypothetical protein
VWLIAVHPAVLTLSSGREAGATVFLLFLDISMDG